jgi:hypothetical protein
MQIFKEKNNPRFWNIFCILTYIQYHWSTFNSMYYTLQIRSDLCCKTRNLTYKIWCEVSALLAQNQLGLLLLAACVFVVVQ